MADQNVPASDLATFITSHLDAIIAEWEAFAKTLLPAAGHMDGLALRDHARQILEAIAADIVVPQTDAQSRSKSRGGDDAAADPGLEHAAGLHGKLRHEAGFDLRQLFAEYRALRASVLRLWARDAGPPGREAPAQVTRFNEAIDQALAESVARYADQVARSRETFIAVLGDDLRGPLDVVNRAAEALAAAEVGPDARLQEAARVRSGALAISQTVRDLLEYSRARLGRPVPLRPQVVRIDAILRESVAEVRTGHPQASLRIETTSDLVAFGDGPRIEQAVANLLTNAVLHGRPGGVVLLVAREAGGLLEIEVANEGPVIAPRVLQFIFDPLLRQDADPRRGSARQRLGLGLFIAREIALAHGGGIEATSTDARTTFTLRIPLRQQTPGS